MGRIESRPSDGLTYNPNEPKYWDPGALKAEVDRTFDICHGCRLCFNLCPSFPALFDAVDAQDGDVLALTKQERDQVEKLCYQCKLCYVKCPYTPDDGHEFQLDFPRLLIRHAAVRAKAEGIGMREKMLADPDRLARLVSISPSMANWGNRNRLGRIMMEKTIGIHRDKILPEFASERFETWYRKHEGTVSVSGEAAKVALFYTCYVNNNTTQVGKDTLRVLEKNACTVRCPKQNCCGMPALEQGDIDFARKQAQSNVESLLPLVRDGYRVVVPGPSCSLMMRKEYGELLGTPEAGEVASATRDTCEFLFELKREGKFNRDFRSTPGTIGYHVPCHLRFQNIGFRSRDMMKLIPGTSISIVERCTAHDGTWAMKKEYFALSMEVGKPTFDAMRETEADVLVSDCPLAALQIEQGMGKRPIHPMQVLARAYETDGFPNPVPPKEES